MRFIYVWSSSHFLLSAIFVCRLFIRAAISFSIETIAAAFISAYSIWFLVHSVRRWRLLCAFIKSVEINLSPLSGFPTGAMDITKLRRLLFEYITVYNIYVRVIRHRWYVLPMNSIRCVLSLAKFITGRHSSKTMTTVCVTSPEMQFILCTTPRPRNQSDEYHFVLFFLPIFIGSV